MSAFGVRKQLAHAWQGKNMQGISLSCLLLGLGEEVEASSGAFGGRANFYFFPAETSTSPLYSLPRGCGGHGRKTTRPPGARRRNACPKPCQGAGLSRDGAFGPCWSTPGYPRGAAALTAAAPPALGW